MINDTVVRLNTSETDLLIHILSEITGNKKIPKIINETVNQELFSDLDIAKVLSDLVMKLGKEKFEQLSDLVEEEQNEVRTYAIKLSDNDLDYLRQGDYSEIETTVEDILRQIDKQEA